MGVRKSFKKRSIPQFLTVNLLALETIAITVLTQAGSIMKDRMGDQDELECTVKLGDESNTFLSQTTAAIFISQQTSGFQLYLEVKFLLKLDPQRHL